MSSLASIPNIIPVLSGKGGVGKSSVTVQLALALALRGHAVGVLDIDLTGPSIPRLFGVEDAKVRQAPGGWLPVVVHEAGVVVVAGDAGAVAGAGASARGGEEGEEGQLQRQPRRLGPLVCMSLGFLLRTRGDAVVWRGPKKTAMVAQLLREVRWPDGLRYLLIDTPPGTSDEHIALATALLDQTPSQTLPPPPAHTQTQRVAAVVVTTPQAVATADVRKELSFCRTVGLHVAGVVENMAGFVCPCCGEATNVFSRGGGRVMAEEWGCRFLGEVPVDGEGWGMLVEERRRPAYGSSGVDAADVGAGEERGKVDGPEDAAGGGDGDETATMADMYTSCSLWPLFDGIAAQLEEDASGAAAGVPP